MHQRIGTGVTTDPRGGVRNAGRARAIQLVYAYEQNRFVDDGFLLVSLDEDEAPALSEAQEFAAALFALFREHRVPVDAAVDARLENWTIHRLAVADRAILRLGAVELLYCPDTPPKVAINEYIELAKLYGSDAKTAKLVNGVLDRLAREHRAAEIGKK